MKRIRIVILAVMLLSLMAASSLMADTTYDYTLLIYMNGSDLESDYHAGSDDLLEMITADLPENVAVIIQTGGTRDWHTNQYGLPTVSATKVQRWRLTDTTMELLENVGNINMGASQTLSGFVDYGVSNYDSDQYSLIMWNHGAGAVYGYGVDELHDYDSLSLDELQTALEDSVMGNGNRFDLVGFDACLMGSVEVGHVLAPFADYLVGSEELEPGHGWNYTPILNHIATNPDATAVELGDAIINGFVDHSRDNGTDDAITLSLTDLSKIDEVVAALNGLLSRVKEDLLVEGTKEQLLKYRLEAESYGEGSSGGEEAIPDSDMVDIIDYASLLKVLYPEEAQAVIDNVTDAVLISVNSPFKPDAAGLSMYIPARDRDTMPLAADILDDIGMSTVYDDFIRTLSTVILGSDVTLSISTETTVIDESDSDVNVTVEDNSIEGDDQFFYIQMNEADLASVNEIYTVMGKIDENGDIQYLARDLVDDEAIGEDGLIVGETLDYWVRIKGMDVAMYYEGHDESGVITYSIPVILNGENADLMVLFSSEYPKGHILGARIVDTDHINVQNRSLTELQPTDWIDFYYEYDAYDIVKGIYIYDGWYYMDGFTVGDGLQLEWAPLPVGDYAYCFEILDVYGDVVYTDWLVYDYFVSATESDTVDDAIWDNLEENAAEPVGGLDANGSYPWLGEDVSAPSEWAIPHINTAYNNNLMTDSAFDGFTEDVTREVFCELVVNMYETITDRTIAISDPDAFTDTSNIEIVKAFQLGIVTGYGDGTFGPDDLVNREQLITMFYRALVLLDESLLDYYYPGLAFEDASTLSLWAEDPARLLVYHELINGVGDNRLAPKNNATLEQSIKLVNGVYEFHVTYSMP